MALKINDIAVPYPDFKEGDILDEAQFDANNAEIVGKINEIIARLYLDEQDLDLKIYTTNVYNKIDLDAGQLDNRYYTETEINSLDGQNIKKTGDQSMDGVKTFTESPIVPTPTTDTQVSNKKYVDDEKNELAGVGRVAETLMSLKALIEDLETTKADILNFYSKVQLQSSGQALVHWDNITNVPPMADSAWKPPVPTVNDLPTTGNEDGDLRVVLFDDIVWTYDVDHWKILGASGSGISDHGTLVGLLDDDHTQYLRGDGTRALNGDMDIADNQLLNVIVHKSAVPPTNVEAKLWYDTINHKLKVYNGTGWADTTGQGALIQDIEIIASSGQTIFNITNGDTQSYETGSNTMSVYKKNINGLYELLDQDDYVETDSDNITLNTSALLGEEYYFKWIKNVASIIDSIPDGSITNIKMDIDSINTLNIVDGAIINSKIFNGTITDDKLSDTAGQIKDRVLGKLNKSGGTLTGAVIMDRNTGYTTPQGRNVLHTAFDPTGPTDTMGTGNGDEIAVYEDFN